MALITNITLMSFVRISIESRNYCISNEQVILLDMECTESQELPVVWLISTCLTLIVDERTDGRTRSLQSRVESGSKRTRKSGTPVESARGH